MCYNTLYNSAKAINRETGHLFGADKEGSEKDMLQNRIKQNLTLKQKVTFLVGIMIFLTGFGILSFLGIRKFARDIHRSRLMHENTVVEIPDLHIKAPVLEGVEQSVLAEAAGHFPGTGSIGSGNYCIAAHSSVLYKEYFNNLKNAQNGMEIALYRQKGKHAVYQITEMKIVDPHEVSILDDAGDVVTGILQPNEDSAA